MRNNKSVLEKRFNLQINGKTLICKKCSFVWEVKKLRYDRNMSCPNCHPIEHGSSKGECELYDALLTSGLNIEHNNRTVLEGKELDLYFPELNFAIEYDGKYWHDKSKDSEKEELCKLKNIKLLRIDDSDFTKNKEKVLQDIVSFIKTNFNLEIKLNTIKDSIIRVSGKAQKIICTDTGEIFDNYIEAAKKINCMPSSIGNVCNGTNPNIKGFHFKYYNPNVNFEKTEKKFEYKTRHIKCLETNEVFESIQELKRLGVSSIFDCVSGRQKTAKKLHWEYTDEPVNNNCEFLKLPKEKHTKEKKEKKLKKILCLETNQIFNSIEECANFFNAPNLNTISRVCRGERKAYKGYHFTYLEENNG